VGVNREERGRTVVERDICEDSVERRCFVCPFYELFPDPTIFTYELDHVLLSGGGRGLLPSEESEGI
jgi:hypothetical protein